MKGSIKKRSEIERLSYKVVGAAIEVHKALGPGLLESAYEQCMAFELRSIGVAFERQKPLPVVYKGVALDCGYRLDFLVDEAIVLELKTVKSLQKIHHAQILSYLKMGNWRLGLLLNFNVELMKRGVRRVANKL